MTNLDKKKVLLADLSLFFIAFIWGGGFIAAKIALFSITPLYLLSFRFLGSGIIMFIIFFHKIKNINKQDILAGISLGMLLYVGQTFQTIGLKYTTAGKQAFLVATYTILVPFISWFLTKKKPDIYSIFGGLLTLIGVGFLSLQESLSISFGDSLTLIFALMFAIQIVLTGIYAPNINPINLTTVQFLTAGTFTFISALVFEAKIKLIHTEAVLSILYLVIFNTLIAFLVQNIAQKYTSDTHASIIISLQSVFGCFLSVILMGEIFTKNMVLGCTLIFTAIIISKLKDNIFKIKDIFFILKPSKSNYSTK